MKGMLDDLKYIHERDSEDALGIAEKQWQQLSHKFQVTSHKLQKIRNIVFAGMGGSRWPVYYLLSWPGVNLPLTVNSDYAIPKHVNEHTLFIASSYSGNTEETISAFHQAEVQGAQIVVITSGGRLEQLAREKELPMYRLPKGTQPRMSSFYFIAALLELLAPLGIVSRESLDERAAISEWLRDQTATWRPEVPASQNPAKRLARELMGKTAIIYSGPLMAPAARKWKICINESAKNLAWWNEYPEFNHNEFIGWTGQPLDKPFGVVEIRSKLEHERVGKRFTISERLLSGRRPAPEIVEPAGDTVAKQLFWTSMFGDFVSIYLALLNGINPTPVDLVEKLKAELNK